VKRKGSQEDAVHDAEERRVDANAYRQAEHGQRGETAIARYGSHDVAQVLEKHRQSGEFYR
jgi:hypothetical protein